MSIVATMPHHIDNIPRASSSNHVNTKCLFLALKPYTLNSTALLLFHHIPLLVHSIHFSSPIFIRKESIPLSCSKPKNTASVYRLSILLSFFCLPLSISTRMTSLSSLISLNVLTDLESLDFYIYLSSLPSSPHHFVQLKVSNQFSSQCLHIYLIFFLLVKKPHIFLL